MSDDREARIARYYQGEHASQLAEWLVDAEDEIETLEKRSKILSRLEAAGVDNWEGYSYAFQDEDEEDD
jgi:hypothetical protein